MADSFVFHVDWEVVVIFIFLLALVLKVLFTDDGTATRTPPAVSRSHWSLERKKRAMPRRRTSTNESAMSVRSRLRVGLGQKFNPPA